MFTGHPKGLFRLFFIEMWERLAFYTMVGALLLYATDTENGGLAWSQAAGNEVYGLYLAFVYFTPYLGGLIADRVLGYRKSVLIGGILFAAGFFLLSTGQSWTFPVGLILLCCGNGFFKPNISAMVGNLYVAGDPKRDAGFNIFYMGINIGAFVANFLVALMRNTEGWRAVFFAAGVGMALSVLILLASWKVLAKADIEPGNKPGDTPFSEIMLKILGPALLLGGAGWAFAEFMLPEGATDLVRSTDYGFLIGAIPIIIFFATLSRKASDEEKPGLKSLIPIYVAGGAFFMVLHLNGSAMTTWANENTARHVGTADPVVAVADLFRVDGKPVFAGPAYPSYYENAAADVPRPTRSTMLPIGTLEQTRMFGQKKMDDANLAALTAKLPNDVRVEAIPPKAERSEQQEGWSKFAVEVYPKVTIEETTDSHGLPVISVTVDDGAVASQNVAFIRSEADKSFATYLITPEKFEAMYAGDPPVVDEPGTYLRAANAELYQSWNAFFVIAFTPLIMLFFAWTARKKIDFSTARKVLAGMVITGLAVLFMAGAGFLSNNGEIKVSGMWLMGFYAIVTVGELCLSPMALSLVTKLSPKRFVGLTMGGWFFATAIGNKFSGFLGVLQGSMAPAMFFIVIAVAVALVAGYILAVLPKLDAAIKKYGA